MTNYISEKDLWQAINSIKNENILQLYNYMLQLRCRFKILFPSYERLAAHFGVTVKTIGRWFKQLKELYLITDKKRWLQTSLYQINSMVLKFSEKYKQIFPALRHFTENALVGIFSSNVLHNYNDINNSDFSNGVDANNSLGSSSSFLPSSFNLLNGRSEPTFFESYYFQAQVSLEVDIDLTIQHTQHTQHTFVNKLTEEEAEEIFGSYSKYDHIERELTIPELMEWYKENMKNLN